jgi:ABC-type branched-subunit amino acid transport system substrate-binding protein
MSLRAALKAKCLVALLLLAAMVLAAGCGSSSSSNTSGGSSGSSGGGQSSGSTIKVGTLIPLTGTGLNFPDYLAGAKAAVQAVNAKGGIHGHPIDLIECDDQNNPNQAAVCARNMVSSHVVAVVGGVSLFGAQEAQILKAANIPWIGGLPITGPESVLSNEYPIASGNLSFYGPVGYFAKKAGQTSLAGFVLQGELGTETAQELQAGAKAVGIPYKGTVTVPIDATDYAPYVQKLKGLGADAIGTQLAGPQFLLLATASAQAGDNWQLYQSAVGTPPNIFSALAKIPSELARVTPMSAVPPADPKFASMYPGISSYRKDMAAYESKTSDTNGTPSHYTSGSISSWQAIEAFAKLGSAAPSDAISSSSSFVSALSKSGPVDTGLGPAWNPPPPNGPNSKFPRATNGSSFAWALKNGAFTLSVAEPANAFDYVK